MIEYLIDKFMFEINRLHSLNLHPQYTSEVLQISIREEVFQRSGQGDSLHTWAQFHQMYAVMKKSSCIFIDIT